MPIDTEVVSEAEEECPAEGITLEEEVTEAKAEGVTEEEPEESVTGEIIMADGPVSYLNASGTETSAERAFLVTPYDMEWSEGWYVVDGTLTDENRIMVFGTVNLILCDNARLTASAGITVYEDSTLTIYAQSDGCEMGQLEAIGTDGGAGIGGGWSDGGSNDDSVVTISGGHVQATGENGGAGIGGSAYRYGGVITIGGGCVTALANPDENGCSGEAIGNGMLEDGDAAQGSVTLSFSNAAAAFGARAGNDEDDAVFMSVEDFAANRTQFHYAQLKATAALLTAPAAKELTYNGAEQDLVQAGSSDDGTIYYKLCPDGSYSEMVPMATDAGDYTVYYKVVDATGSLFDSPEGSVRVTIYQAASPVTVTDTADVMTGGNSVDLADYVQRNGAAGAVSYAISGDANGCTLDGSVLTSGASTGSVTVIVTVAADENYDALEATPIVVTVSARNAQTITASDLTATYGDTDKFVSATVTVPATGGGAISYAVKSGSGDYIDVDPSTGALTIKKAGTAIVVVTAGATQQYEQASREVTVTIRKANPTASAPTGLTATYGQTLGEVPLTNPQGNTPGEWTWADASASVGNAGSHTFQASFTPTDTVNYNGAENVDVAVEVSKQALTVTADAQTRIYGQDDPNLTYNVEGLVGADTLTGVLVRTAGEDAGSGNYNKATKKVTVTVYPTAPAGISVKNSKAKTTTAAWKKMTGITGFELQASTDKTFKTGVKKATAKAGATSGVFQSLTKGKTWYFRVRCYKTVSGKNIYSSWSSVKSVKVTK